MILQRFEAPITIACFISMKPENRWCVIWESEQNSFGTRTNRASTDKNEKHANNYIKDCSLYSRVCRNYLHVFGGPGGYPYQGYLSSRPPDMRAGARAHAFSSPRRRKDRARAPLLLLWCTSGFPAAKSLWTLTFERKFQRPKALENKDWTTYLVADQHGQNVAGVPWHLQETSGPGPLVDEAPGEVIYFIQFTPQKHFWFFSLCGYVWVNWGFQSFEHRMNFWAR